MKSWPYYKQKARAIADEFGHTLGNFKAEGSNMQWTVCTKCKLPAIIKKDAEHFRRYTGSALVSRCPEKPLQFKSKEGSKILRMLP